MVKLSPNLTIGGKVPVNSELTIEEYERQKMENLLTIVGKFENGWSFIFIIIHIHYRVGDLIISIYNNIFLKIILIFEMILLRKVHNFYEILN